MRNSNNELSKNKKIAEKNPLFFVILEQIFVMDNIMNTQSNQNTPHFSTQTMQSNEETTHFGFKTVAKTEKQQW